MKNNVLEIGLNLLRNEITTYSLSEDFLIFDNFSDSNKSIITLSGTDYPVRFEVYFIGFCIEGSSRLRVGQQYISLEKNCFLTIPAGRTFQPLESSDDFKFATILLNPNFFPLQEEHTQAYNLYGKLFGEPSHLLPEEFMEEMMQIYQLIKEKINDNNHTYRKNIIRNYLLIMFYNICHLLLSVEKKSGTTDNRKERVFKRFIKEVEQHFREERSVTFYADKLCLTPKYFSTLIYDVSGRLPREWIQDLVILEAQALLKTSNMTIQQISDHLNFPNQSHFGRYFKKTTGHSPKNYRNS